MRVDYDKRRILAAQMQKNRNKRQMFSDIGEVSGMKSVTIIHLFAEDPYFRMLVVDIDLQVAELFNDLFQAFRG